MTFIKTFSNDIIMIVVEHADFQKCHVLKSTVIGQIEVIVTPQCTQPPSSNVPFNDNHNPNHSDNINNKRIVNVGGM